jgi:hypothetical protein
MFSAQIYRVRSYCFVVATLCTIMVGLASCSNSTIIDPPQVLQPTSRLVANLRPDSATGVGLFRFMSGGFILYSFDRDTVVSLSQFGTNQWDILLPFMGNPLTDARSRAVHIMLNSGNINPNRLGGTQGAIVDSLFDNVNVMPNILRTDDTATAQRIIPTSVVPPSNFFTYSFSGAQIHTLSAPTIRTVVLRTASGNNVKLQITSIYQNAVSAPTIATPIGFYTFRYTKTGTSSFR